jgi:hypothetical protein
VSNQAVLDYFSDDISIIEGNKNELLVFMNNEDKLSFLELLKLNNQTNNRTLISLNSIENINKFLTQFQNFDGKVFLCLNGDQTGNLATEKILSEFQNKNIKDIHLLYGISENGTQNLSEYLKNKLNLQEKNATFVEAKNSENGNNFIKSNRVPDTQHV